MNGIMLSTLFLDKVLVLAPVSPSTANNHTFSAPTSHVQKNSKIQGSFQLIGGNHE